MSNFKKSSGILFLFKLSECHLNFSFICFSRLLYREITVLILLLASCRANQTAMDYCGDGNTCLGSVSSYVCVCEAPGWRLNPSNYKECMEGTISLYCFRGLVYPVKKLHVQSAIEKYLTH